MLNIKRFVPGHKGDESAPIEKNIENLAGALARGLKLPQGQLSKQSTALLAAIAQKIPSEIAKFSEVGRTELYGLCTVLTQRKLDGHPAVKDFKKALKNKDEIVRDAVNLQLQNTAGKHAANYYRQILKALDKSPQRVEPQVADAFVATSVQPQHSVAGASVLAQELAVYPVPPPGPRGGSVLRPPRHKNPPTGAVRVGTPSAPRKSYPNAPALFSADNAQALGKDGAAHKWKAKPYALARFNDYVQKHFEAAGKTPPKPFTSLSVISQGDEFYFRGERSGKGGFAKFYLALDKDLELKAIRQLRPEARRPFEALRRIDRRFRGDLREPVTQYTNEAELNSELKIMDLVKSPLRPTVQMKVEGHDLLVGPYMPGGDLDALDKKLIREKKALSHNAVIGILRQAARGLQNVHTFAVHRDVKAANILIDAKGDIELADYGLAAEGKVVSGLYGTPGMTAPEVLEHELSDAASDAFSVGLMALGLLSKNPLAHVKESEEADKLKEFTAWHKQLQRFADGSLDLRASVKNRTDPWSKSVQLCLSRRDGSEKTLEIILRRLLDPNPKNRWSMQQLAAEMEKQQPANGPVADAVRHEIREASHNPDVKPHREALELFARAWREQLIERMERANPALVTA